MGVAEEVVGKNASIRHQVDADFAGVGAQGGFREEASPATKFWERCEAGDALGIGKLCSSCGNEGDHFVLLVAGDPMEEGIVGGILWVVFDGHD